MHTVVVGAGRIGTSVARWLVSARHEVSVIDPDRSRCSALDDQLGSITVAGRGTDASVLSRAGTNRAEAFIVTTSHDDINLAAAQLAKHKFSVPRTISVVNSPEHTSLFRSLGIDVTIDVTELVLSHVQQGISSHGLVRLMPVSNNNEQSIVCIKIPPGAGNNGRTVKDIQLPDNTILSLVIGRDGNAAIPKDDTLIRPGDEVIAVTTAQEEENLRDNLVRTDGE